MASWFDLIAFALTASAFVGVIYGVKFVLDRISTTVSATKESLKNRGLTISDKGVSVRTSSRYSREDYLDATQRGFIKAMGASSFATATASGADEPPQSKPVLSRHNSEASVNSTRSAHTGKDSSGSEERKKHRFSFKKKSSYQ